MARHRIDRKLIKKVGGFILNHVKGGSILKQAIKQAMLTYQKSERTIERYWNYFNKL